MLQAISLTFVTIATIGLIVSWIVKKENAELKSDFDKKIGFIKSAISNIVTALENYGIKVKQPYFFSESPKKITEKGYELLKKHDLNSYIDDNCDLLKDGNLKEKTDAQIFIKCLNWLKTNIGQEKIVEIRLHNNINQEDCEELLALFILEKIKKSSPHK